MRFEAADWAVVPLDTPDDGRLRRVLVAHTMG